MTPKVFFRWVAWLLVCAITVFTLAPIQFRPVTAAPVSLERFAAFATIGAAFCLGYPKHRLPILILLLGFVGSSRSPRTTFRAAMGACRTGAAFAAFISRYGGLLRETGADEEL